MKTSVTIALGLSVVWSMVLAAPMNVAVDKAATARTYLNSYTTPPKGCDGKTNGIYEGSTNNTIYHSASSPITQQWWRVDLGVSVPLDEMRLYNRIDYNPGRLRDITINVFDRYTNLVYTSPMLNVSNLAYGGPYVWNNGPWLLTNRLAKPVVGRIIEVTREIFWGTNQYVPDQDRHILQFAECMVLADNLAVGKTASQSSTDYGAVASRAVDGNIEGAWASNSVTHTASTDTNAWWMVNLGQRYHIYGVVIHNRHEAVGRLRDLTVEILETNGTTVVASYGLLNPNNSAYDPNPNEYYGGGPACLTVDIPALSGGPVLGQHVRVRRTPSIYGYSDADKRVLSMAEVEVYGCEPPQGTIILMK